MFEKITVCYNTSAFTVMTAILSAIFTAPMYYLRFSAAKHMQHQLLLARETKLVGVHLCIYFCETKPMTSNFFFFLPKHSAT